jgi:uncharacterized membrane protein
MHPTSATGFMTSPLLLGFLCIGLGIPLALGKVKPNHFYGFRISKTLKDESVWYKVNAFTGRAFIWCGATILAAAFAVLALTRSMGLSAVALQVMSAVIVMVPLAVTVVVSSVVCYRA